MKRVHRERERPEHIVVSDGSSRCHRLKRTAAAAAARDDAGVLGHGNGGCLAANLGAIQGVNCVVGIAAVKEAHKAERDKLAAASIAWTA